MSDYLTGAGHFGFGFLVGYIISALMLVTMKKNLSVRLYSPFLPFFIGVLASLPYFFIDRFTCDVPSGLNIFLFYSLLHCQTLAIKFLGDIHVVVVVCGFLYVTVIMYYINFIKRVRRCGWNRYVRTTKQSLKRSAPRA